jgi:glyoxylase-like metal-dependent hydrolase (beta-lactamase superfamily II)
MGSWHTVEAGILLYRDSCNVYAVQGYGRRWILINAGTGRAAVHLGELGEVRELTVLLTHHFRDHASGAGRFQAGGARVVAPYWERGHLGGAQTESRGGDPWLLYDLSWDRFAPLEALDGLDWAMDYESVEIAGLRVQTVPTPGPTMGAVTYVVDLPGGRRVAFVGELMCGDGKLPRLSPLQYEYNDLIGGQNVLASWDRVLAARPDAAFPSLGDPIGPLAAGVARLRANLERFDAIQPGYAARLKGVGDEIEEVLPRLYRARSAVAETHFIIGRSGRVLALDYGYAQCGITFPRRAAFSTRRTLLHSVEALGRVTGRARIDTVLATHYHDDHIGGVGLLQRLFATELWAGENFADLVERPAEFNRPCLWPEKIRVTRRLALGAAIQWDDVSITLHPMVGHTEFSTLLLIEFDGRRVAHTGDQYFYQTSAGQNSAPHVGGAVFTNHVYRNGLALGGYADCLRLLRAFDPELILSGHALPYRPDAEAWRQLERASQAFDKVHRALMPIGDAEVHFGPESQPALLQPYSLLLPGDGGTARLHGWVLNPFGRETRATLGFVTPRPEWSAAPVELSLAAREKRGFEGTLCVPPGTRCRRVPIALDLAVDGRPFGQVAEAWVTVGYDSF